MLPVLPMLPVANVANVANAQLGVGNCNWQHFHIGNIKQRPFSYHNL